MSSKKKQPTPQNETLPASNNSKPTPGKQVKQQPKQPQIKKQQKTTQPKDKNTQKAKKVQTPKQQPNQPVSKPSTIQASNQVADSQSNQFSQTPKEPTRQSQTPLTKQKLPTNLNPSKTLHKPAQNPHQDQADDALKMSGILDAYEQFLKTLCRYGLPTGDVYQFAAQQIEKFQKKRRTKELKIKAEMEIQKAGRRKQEIQKQKGMKKYPKLA